MPDNENRLKDTALKCGLYAVKPVISFCARAVGECGHIPCRDLPAFAREAMPRLIAEAGWTVRVGAKTVPAV